MIDLAQHAGLGPVQSHDIAERQDVPEPYLNQLLTLLRKAGLIASRRGPGGGHFLARPATRITLAEVVTALEGPVWTPDDEEAGRWESLQGVWDEVAEAVKRILEKVTLYDLLEREQSRDLTYQI